MSCPDCFKGFVHDGTPSGTIESIHGMDTYVASPPDAGTNPSATIIFVFDAFGMNLVNNKLLADKYAASTGCRVLMPDLIPGGGAPLSAIDHINRLSTPVGWLDLAGQAWRALAAAQVAALMVGFLFRTRGVFPVLLAYARAVKAELGPGAKLGVAGFCWGGLQSTWLARESATEQDAGVALVDAHFTAHPSGLKVPDDFTAGGDKLRVPLSIAIGDNDMVLPKKSIAPLKEGLEAAFGDDKERYEVVVYEGCTHGFAIRADPSKTTEDKAAVEAAAQAERWFRKHLQLK